MDIFRRDLKQAVRSFQQNPLMALIAVSVLAFGIGANTALFSEVNMMLIRPLPVPAPERVARVASQTATGSVTYAQYFRFQNQNRTFAQLSAFQDAGITFRYSGAPELMTATVVTGNYFSILSPPPLIGRLIGETDDRSGAPEVVMLSEDFWRSRFAADPSVIGKTVAVNGVPCTIAGVTPEWFGGADRDEARELWIPWSAMHERQPSNANMIGRLRNGISLRQAEADLSVIASQMNDETHPREPLTVIVRVAHLVPPIVSRQVVPLFVFFVILAILSMTIPCLNIGSLFLAKSAERRREMGIRIALGAGRGQLLRQLLTESFLIAIVAFIAGLCVFLATLGVFVAYFDVSRVYATRLVMDWRVMAFALALSLVTTIISGIAPALHSASTEVLSALKDGESTGTFQRSRLRSLFIVGQVAVSALLLAMSALFVRSLTSSHLMDLGFDTNGLITGRINLDTTQYGAEQGATFYKSLLRNLQTSPGLSSASIVELNGPLGVGAAKTRAVGLPETATYSTYVVSPGLFRTLGIPVLAGRDFNDADVQGRPRVGIVDESAAQHQWPGQTPIGKSLDGVEIIGLVRNTNYLSNSITPRQFLYLPLTQNYTPHVLLIAKAKGNPAGAIPFLRDTVAMMDPDTPLADAFPFSSLMDLSLRPVRIVATVSSVLGTMALILAAIGIYGIVAFLARQRTREIGIRIALGAPQSRVARLITRQALRWTIVGLAVGFGLAILTARALRGLLFGVAVTDPLAFVSVTLLLAMVTLIASWVPARRASRVDPVAALRHE
jgi:putative ABC transport system permease protein